MQPLPRRKYCGRCAEPHNIDGHELHITASIGIVTYPRRRDGCRDALMKKADVAMYHAKDTGRDMFQFFKPEMNALAIERQSLEDSLHYAIERRELLLYYQPKVDLKTGNYRRRGAHPVGPPAARARASGQFIAIAEECGLIVPIGRWVLREACRQARAWQVAGLPPTSVAVNVSSVELRDPDFVSGIREILRETGLEARYLELELTETVLMQDSRSAMQVLKDLKGYRPGAYPG
jgi:predicted signal transduction protein with EAL and GGDEF domain